MYRGPGPSSWGLTLPGDIRPRGGSSLEETAGRLAHPRDFTSHCPSQPCLCFDFCLKFQGVEPAGPSAMLIELCIFHEPVSVRPAAR